MGKGKTSAAINFINQADEDEKFLFITPYLTEVKRIKEKCPDKLEKCKYSSDFKLEKCNITWCFTLEKCKLLKFCSCL